MISLYFYWQHLTVPELLSQKNKVKNNIIILYTHHLGQSAFLEVGMGVGGFTVFKKIKQYLTRNDLSDISPPHKLSLITSAEGKFLYWLRTKQTTTKKKEKKSKKHLLS